jgi:hypothetical protein
MQHTTKSDPFGNPEVIGRRSLCQTCRTAGREVDRIPVRLAVDLEKYAPATA